jgi:hypothetical protein
MFLVTIAIRQSTTDGTPVSRVHFTADFNCFQMDFYRFSISWPRILPTGHVHKVNAAGVAFYNNLINEIKSKGLEPVVSATQRAGCMGKWRCSSMRHTSIRKSWL